MVLRVIVPLVLVLGAMLGVWIWYRRKLAELAPDETERALPAARLTSERLRTLPHPPWRVVFEVGERSLGNVDHVVVGPTGVIAIETSMTDRPVVTTQEASAGHAQLMANAAIARAEVDDLTRTIGVPCGIIARVYWGTPFPDLPAAHDLGGGIVLVEGQRLDEWLLSRPPGPLTPAQVDQVWSTVLTGIGRPDPLA